MIHKFVSVIILFFFLSCSSEKPAEVGSQKPSEAGGGRVSDLSRPPASSVSTLYSLEIVPTNATRSSTIHLVAQGFKPSDAKIVWLVNGNPVADSTLRAVSETPSQFKAIETKKGDTVQARAIIKGREILSNSIKIKNAAPELTRIKIMPETFKSGDTLYVDVVGSDIDGDEVTILYEWTKNGEPAGRGKQIETALKRGDKVSVRITPYDGEVHGMPAVLHREIVNMPPVIIEHRRFNFDGSVFTYQVKAKDPENDTLIYSLKTAPAGMTIEKTTGLIKWDVPADFKGKAEVAIVVSDVHGGEAMQSFAFEITTEK